MRKNGTMNTPNPLHPQGAFPDHRGRSHVRLAVFTILAVHVVLLGALLLQGCKRTPADSTLPPEPTNTYVPFEPLTNMLATTSTVPALPPLFPPTPPATSFVVTPPPVPPVPTADAEKEHVVVKGDSFYVLAKKYGTTMKAIAEVNPGVDSSRLKIGQKIKIPSATTAPPSPIVGGDATGRTPAPEKKYVVKSGDTLTKIGKLHGVTVPALRRANNLKTDRLTVGQKLVIPSKPAKAPADTAPAAPTIIEPAPPASTMPPVILPTTPTLPPGNY